jgi:cobalt/nickel transport protein
MDNRTFLAVGIAIALLIGIVAVFMASSDPDGLESTALMVQGQKTLTGPASPDAALHENTDGRFSYSAPMPDYSLGGKFGKPGGIVAIVLGTLLATGLIFGISRLLIARKRKKQAETNQ